MSEEALVASDVEDGAIVKEPRTPIVSGHVPFFDGAHTANLDDDITMMASRQDTGIVMLDFRNIPYRPYKDDSVYVTVDCPIGFTWLTRANPLRMYPLHLRKFDNGTLSLTCWIHTYLSDRPRDQGHEDCEFDFTIWWQE